MLLVTVKTLNSQWTYRILILTFHVKLKSYAFRLAFSLVVNNAKKKYICLSNDVALQARSNKPQTVASGLHVAIVVI